MLCNHCRTSSSNEETKTRPSLNYHVGVDANLQRLQEKETPQTHEDPTGFWMWCNPSQKQVPQEIEEKQS